MAIDLPEAFSLLVQGITAGSLEGAGRELVTYLRGRSNADAELKAALADGSDTEPDSDALAALLRTAAVNDKHLDVLLTRYLNSIDTGRSARDARDNTGVVDQSINTNSYKATGIGNRIHIGDVFQGHSRSSRRPKK